MQHTADGMDDLSDVADWLDYASLVVGLHDRHQRPLRLGDTSLRRIQGDQSIVSDRKKFDAFHREAATAQYGGMLYGRHKQEVARLLATANFQCRRQSQH